VTVSAPNALDRHVALVGFMGAGKTTVGADVAERLGRPLVDVDREVELATGTTVAELFDQHGEAAFRRHEERQALAALERPEPSVVTLGGGALASERTRELLHARAQTVHLEVEPDVAWTRVGASDRPLARDERAFRRLFDERLVAYRRAADARARDVADVVLAAGGVHVELGALEMLAQLLPGAGAVALAADAHVLGIHGTTAQPALGPRLSATHELPAGETAKTLAACERLWRELRIDRDGVLVALGGGSTTDAAGFVASTYLRGIAWAAVPTTLVGQVDAAIGGKTAVDLPEGKNLIGAFHWPVRTVVDPSLLETLPPAQRRTGLAEVVKTGLLAGEAFWELPEPELVRQSAAFKTAVCVRDPLDRGARTALNLGHTFAHALEAASDYALPHGDAVALGLLAALRLSGLDTSVVEEVLRPRRVRADRDRAWEALRRDKKAASGQPRLVLLEAPGRPVTGVQLPEADVRAALDQLILTPG
jgi:3-dehydroquinate synthetase/shikimate kinase